MAITRGEIKADVLTIANKSANTKGYFTDDKMNMGIREAQAYIAVTAFDAGQGWQNKVRFLPMASGQYSVPIPPDVSYIDQLRVKIAGVYQPLPYNQMRDSIQPAPGTGSAAFPTAWRILDNQIFVDPPMQDGDSNAIWLECTTYPKRLVNDADVLEGHYDDCMRWFMVYRVCSFCAKSVGKADPEWADFEAQWHEKLLQILNKRDNQIKYIRNFED